MNREQRRKMLKKMTKTERKAFKEGYKNALKVEVNREFSQLQSAFEKKWEEDKDIFDKLVEVEEGYPLSVDDLKQIMRKNEE